MPWPFFIRSETGHSLLLWTACVTGGEGLQRGRKGIIGQVRCNPDYYFVCLRVCPLTAVLTFEVLISLGNLLASEVRRSCFKTKHFSWNCWSSYPATGSGRVFSGSGIWPKNGAGFGKAQNIMTGFGIWLLPGKRDSPKFACGMRDFLACLSGNRHDPNKRSRGKSESTRRVQNINRKGQYTSCTSGFGIMMEKVRDAGFSWKRSGNAGPGPPFQTLLPQSTYWHAQDI